MSILGCVGSLLGTCLSLLLWEAYLPILRAVERGVGREWLWLWVLIEGTWTFCFWAALFIVFSQAKRGLNA
jgi:hypothetical protein